MLRINKSQKTGINSNDNGVFCLFYLIFQVSCWFFMIQYHHQRVAWKVLHNLHKCALFANPLLKWSYSSSVLPMQVYPRTSNPSYDPKIGQYSILQKYQSFTKLPVWPLNILPLFLEYSYPTSSCPFTQLEITVHDGPRLGFLWNFHFSNLTLHFFSYSNTIYEFASVKVLKSSTIICVCVYWSLCVCLFLFLLADITFIVKHLS